MCLVTKTSRSQSVYFREEKSNMDSGWSDLVSHGITAVGSALIGVASAAVVLWVRFRKAETERTKQESQLELEDLERRTKVDMDVHSQVVQQLSGIISGYEERFREVVRQSAAREAQQYKQMEERELQFQDIVNKLRAEHIECIRHQERAEGRIRQLETTVQELRSLIESRMRKPRGSNPEEEK